eukprot:TRINITY_DN3115_c0_g4_i1.p1 TRINITY_DN3115_c0_g4~~TRINITY_DN3115_c0_g4_i1.p1  ORF type:complete len:424 (+),score=104.39 TRINITY_DN3115_c0_g4_i1:94-1272(+)
MSVDGTVKRWDDAKGFGFIAPCSGGDDVFVHRNSIGGPHLMLEIGAPVSYDYDITPDGRARASLVQGPGVKERGPRQDVPNALPSLGAFGSGGGGGPYGGGGGSFGGGGGGSFGGGGGGSFGGGGGGSFGGGDGGSFNQGGGQPMPADIYVPSGHCPPGHRTGYVKRWDDDRGLGFIRSPSSSEDIIVLRFALGMGKDASLREGAAVFFDVTANPKNPSKYMATKLSGPACGPAEPEEHAHKMQAQQAKQAQHQHQHQHQHQQNSPWGGGGGGGKGVPGAGWGAPQPQQPSWPAPGAWGAPAAAGGGWGGAAVATATPTGTTAAGYGWQAAPSPGMSPGALAGGLWHPTYDPSTGRTYYYNPTTQQVQWEEPPPDQLAGPPPPPPPLPIGYQ